MTFVAIMLISVKILPTSLQPLAKASKSNAEKFMVSLLRASYQSGCRISNEHGWYQETPALNLIQ